MWHGVKAGEQLNEFSNSSMTTVPRSEEKNKYKKNKAIGTKFYPICMKVSKCQYSLILLTN